MIHLLVVMMALTSIVMASTSIVSGRFTIGYLLRLYKNPVSVDPPAFTDIMEEANKLNEINSKNITSSKEYNTPNGMVVVHRIDEAKKSPYKIVETQQGSKILIKKL